MKGAIRRTIEVLPLITIAVIILGYFNLHWLYTSFHIDIYSYLDTSEIIFSFAALTSDLSVLLVGIIGYLFLSSLRPKVAFEDDDIESQTDIRRSRKLAPFVLVFLFVGGTIGVTSSPNPLFYEHGKLLLFVTMVYIPLVVLDGMYLFYHPRFSQYRLHILIPLGIVLCFCYIYILNETYYDVLSSGRGKYFVELTLKGGKQVTTNGNFIFIGSTRNFYFFEDLKSHTNTIVPASEVIEIKQRLLAFEARNIKELIEGRPEADSVR